MPARRRGGGRGYVDWRGLPPHPSAGGAQTLDRDAGHQGVIVVPCQPPRLGSAGRPAEAGLTYEQHRYTGEFGQRIVELSAKHSRAAWPLRDRRFSPDSAKSTSCTLRDLHSLCLHRARRPHAGEWTAKILAAADSRDTNPQLWRRAEARAWHCGHLLGNGRMWYWSYASDSFPFASCRRCGGSPFYAIRRSSRDQPGSRSPVRLRMRYWRTGDDDRALVAVP